MFLSLIATLLVGGQVGSHGPNLVANPEFSGSLSGWQPIYARETGAAHTSVVSGHNANTHAIEIDQTAIHDWAFSQQKAIEVKPGEAYKLSAWMNVHGGAASISVILSDPKKGVTSWSYGAVSPIRKGWQFVERVFLIPDDASRIEFRAVGQGVGTTIIDSPSLEQIPAAKPLSVKRPIILESKDLTLSLSGDGAMVATPKKGRPWHYRPLTGLTQVREIKFQTERIAEIEATDLTNNLPVTATVEIAPAGFEVIITYKASGPVSSNFALQGTPITERGQWIVLPMNEGIRFPVEDNTIAGKSFITYGPDGLSMPWMGVYDPNTGLGTMTIVDTPYDADFEVSKKDGYLTFLPTWESSKGEFSHNRQVRLEFFDGGGYVAMAKRYRQYAKATGLLKTLKEKRHENPNIDKLIGSVDVWNWDMDFVSLCKEMKQMGMDRVLWSNKATADQVRSIESLGFLAGRYDIYQDVWDPNDRKGPQYNAGFPDDLVLEPSGDWMRGYASPIKRPDGSTGQISGGVINSERGLVRAKTSIPADLEKIPYNARFIDTTTASPFREDYSTDHPLTREQDSKFKMDLLSYCSNELKLVTGSESGVFCSVPDVDYFEGMISLLPYRLPDSGDDTTGYRKPTPDFLRYQVSPVYRVPLWELAFHDCVVSFWYWGDASNKAPEVWDRRDLLNILYGTGPTFNFTKAMWSGQKQRMLQTYHDVCDWTRKIGYDELISVEDLTPDHFVQKSTWSSGRSVIVNMSDQTYNGIKTMSFKISE